MASALIGTPPHTQEDYYIVLGIFRRFGFKGDPAQGAKFPPARPVDDHYHSRGPGYIGEFSVLIFLTVFIVGSRLLIRALSRAVKWGWDDWLIIPAAVSPVRRARAEKATDEGKNIAAGLDMV